MRESDLLTQAQAGAPLRIGYAIEAPFSYVSADGHPTGESVELARWVASRLDIPHVEWRLHPFSDLITALEHREIDVIAAGMFITAERQQRVAFSVPTFRVRPGALGRAADPLFSDTAQPMEPEALAQLDVGVLAGSVEESLCHTKHYDAASVVATPDVLTAVSLLRAGDIDALLLSQPSLRLLAREAPDLKMRRLDPLETAVDSTGAFAFRHSDPRLREAWDEALHDFLATPQHLELITPFGLDARNLP